jgi:hypothetical protein
VALRDDVRARAADCCEYCQLSQTLTALPHEIDHIIAQKHGGASTSGNLCLACFYCNSNKGPNIAGIDPDTGQITVLFHPRRDRWSEHFFWTDGTLIGKTASARATIAVLGINLADRIENRRLLIFSGVWSPAT